MRCSSPGLDWHEGFSYTYSAPHQVNMHGLAAKLLVCLVRILPQLSAPQILLDEQYSSLSLSQIWKKNPVLQPMGKPRFWTRNYKPVLLLIPSMFLEHKVEYMKCNSSYAVWFKRNGTAVPCTSSLWLYFSPFSGYVQLRAVVTSPHPRQSSFSPWTARHFLLSCITSSFPGTLKLRVSEWASGSLRYPWRLLENDRARGTLVGFNSLFEPEHAQ